MEHHQVAFHKSPALLEEVIDLGLVEGFNATAEFIADCKGQIRAQVARVRELRQKKEEDPLGYFEGTMDVDVPDNVSLAPTDSSTTGGSIFTRYTDKTKGTLGTA